MEFIAIFKQHFSDLEDPRVENKNFRHLFSDILLLSLLATIAGADGWHEIEEYGHQQEDMLREFLVFPNGIPSHDTLSRVFSRLDPLVFEECFISWVNSLYQVRAGEVISVDGKSTNASRDKRKGLRPLHLVSAWSSEANLVLGQRKTDVKSNEITAIPDLLAALDIKGATITIDAMGCQKKIAAQIIRKEANYLFSVKGNHKRLEDALETTFNKAQAINFENMVYDQYETVDGDHGRIETRKHTVLPLMYLYQFKLPWKGLQSLIRVERTREYDDKVEQETQYYISSLAPDASNIAKVVREHWHVENKLHWCLDVAFNDDRSRIRKGHSAENFAIIKRVAINLIKQETSVKLGIKNKRKCAGWNKEYLFKVLSALSPSREAESSQPSHH